MPTVQKKQPRRLKASRSPVEKLIDTALELSREERDLIVEVLGRRAHVEDHKPPFDEEFSKELHRRSEELDKNPSKGIPWEVVKAKLLARLDD